MKKFILVGIIGMMSMQILADGGHIVGIKIVDNEITGIVSETKSDLNIVSESNNGDLSIIVLDASGNQVYLKVIYDVSTNQVSFAPNQLLTPQMYTIIITNTKTKAVQIFRIQVL